MVSAIEREAEVIAKKFPQCVAYELDVEKSPEELNSLVKNHDVVVRYIKHFICLLVHITLSINHKL